LDELLVSVREIEGGVGGRPASVVIAAGSWTWRRDFDELVGCWELIYFLVWRDIKVRYKQTLIGVGWAMLQPLATIAIFTFVFGHIAQIPSDNLPYPLFAYAAILAWSYFAYSLSRVAASVVGNAHLISKVYFPRLAVPIAGVLTPTVDFVLSFATFLGLMLWFRTAPTWRIVALPLFLLLAAAAALAFGLWMAPTNARYRDVGLAIPFLTQVWMYASPVIYPVSLVPADWRWLYSLNPMVSVIEGFRWALLGRGALDPMAVAFSVGGVAILLLTGLIHFQRAQRTFADVL
jgi:lipopolysaccharide transport system permease protein